VNSLELNHYFLPPLENTRLSGDFMDLDELKLLPLEHHRLHQGPPPSLSSFQFLPLTDRALKAHLLYVVDLSFLRHFVYN
jgi:hypothetical protein